MRSSSRGGALVFVLAWMSPMSGAGIMSLVATPALAQDAASGQADFNGSYQQFAISGGPLSSALLKWAKVSRHRVLMAGQFVSEVKTVGVSGSLTSEQALRRLLEGTGLSYKLERNRHVTIYDPHAALEARAQAVSLDTIEVTNRATTEGFVATTSTAGAKTSTPIAEIPQTVNVVTAQQIKDQGAQSVSQALRYTPGVFAEGFGGVSPFDTYTQIRGFQPSFFQNGLRMPNGSSSSGYASTALEPYGLERVEVLKGPSSALYGQTVPGGLINLVSKLPTAQPRNEIQVQTGSFDRKQAAVDFSGPADKNGEFLYRIVGLARDSDAQADFVQDNRLFIAPSLTWRPTNDTSLTLFARAQWDTGLKTPFNYVPTSGSLVPNPVFGTIPYNRYLGEPSFDTLNRKQSSVGYQFEHRFNEAVTVRQNAGYFHTDTYLRALNRFGELAPDNVTYSRRAFGIDANANAYAIDNQAEFKFNTMALRHTLLAGFDYRFERNDYNVGRPARVYTINVANPAYGVSIPDPGSWGFTNLSTDESQAGVYAQDQIKFDRWVATIGGRFDKAKASTLNRLTSRTVDQNDSAFTGRVGLNYLFENGLTPYVSYATSFVPNAGVNFAGNSYRPTTGAQIEGGVKYQPPGSNSFITVSVFELKQRNRLTNDVPNPGFFLQTAAARVRGFEIEGKAELTRELNLLASYAYLDHRVTESSTPAEIGLRLGQTPVHQAALWADYTMQSGPLAGFGVGVGLRYVGSTYDTANAVLTPSYTLIDAKLQYDFGYLNPTLRGTKFTVNGTNLFDKYYLTECTVGQGCTLGFSRRILATLSYTW